MMLVPGWVSMRNVSHFPPARIISALAKAAPALVTLVPAASSVALFAATASSSTMSWIACCPPGSWEPRRADASA